MAWVKISPELSYCELPNLEAELRSVLKNSAVQVSAMPGGASSTKITWHGVGWLNANDVQKATQEALTRNYGKPPYPKFQVTVVV